MGNTVSEELESTDAWWQPTQSRNSSSHNSNLVTENSNTYTNIEEMNEAECSKTIINTEESESDSINYVEARKKANEEKMEQFKSELAKKHLARRQAIAERSKEILFLREELARHKKENEELKENISKNQCPQVEDTSWNDNEELRSENERLKNELVQKEEDLTKYQEITQHNHELRLSIAEVQTELQTVNSQVVEFEKERLDYQTHVAAMKEVVKVSKQLLEIRERQLEELRAKVSEIESTLADQESSILSTNLRNEYEKQLRNMRALKTLYEQRQAAMKTEKDTIANELAEVTTKLEKEQSTAKELQERVEELEKDVSDKYDRVHHLESQLGLVQAESRGFQAEMSVINQLFSQILIGFNNGQLDFDKLIILLEENHDLLTDIVINEESVEHISALPKTLLDLVNQVQEKNEDVEDPFTDEIEKDETECSQIEQQPSSSNQVCSPAEIMNNLPKVWRVLAELLRQQSGQQPVLISEDGTDPCYKSVETPKGPKLVLSVSQTFIRLKDLILEKKSLEKEMTRLKQLNTHLEVRLQDQEKRLETVSTELSKTWHVVGRMQRQHQQLHTHEKILRYELSQKRKMLTELKQELEYCREKWEQAREKNSSTEEQWKQLRSEFALRKVTTVDDLNNSAESGYSDEREGSSDDESTYGNANKKAIPTQKETVSDTEENDTEETSHGSDAEDILESAFSKACSSSALPQPNLTLSEVFVLNPDNDIPSTSNVNEIEDTIVINCDNKIDIDISELSSKLHSTENETDVPVQIEESIVASQTSIEQHNSNLESSCSSQTQTVQINENNEILNDKETTLTSQSEEIQTNQEEINDLKTKEDGTSHSEEKHTNQEEINELQTKEDDTSQSKEHSIQTSSQIDDKINVAEVGIPEHLVVPSTSQSTGAPRTSEEMLSKREERLRRLEEQCKLLVKKVTNTTQRGAAISSRLTTLHEQYGSTTETGTQNEDNRRQNVDNQSQNNESQNKGSRTQNESNQSEDTHTQNVNNQCPNMDNQSQNEDNRSQNEDNQSQNEDNDIQNVDDLSQIVDNLSQIVNNQSHNTADPVVDESNQNEEN